MDPQRNLNDKGVLLFPGENSNTIEKKNKWYDIKEATELANKMGEDFAKEKNAYYEDDFKFNSISEYTFRKYANKQINLEVFIPGIGIPKIIDDENDSSSGKKRKLYNFSIIAAIVDPFNNKNEAMYQKIIKEFEAVDYYFNKDWGDDINGPLEMILKNYNLDRKDRAAIIEQINLIIENYFVKNNSALSGQNRLLINQNRELYEKYSHYQRLYNQIADKFQLLDKVQNDLRNEIGDQGDLINEHLILSMSAITKQLKDISSKLN